MQRWIDAVREDRVGIHHSSGTWTLVSREDQRRELQRWASGKPLEKGWLRVRSSGTPHSFVRRNGDVEELCLVHPLRLCTYNLLTSTHNGDPNRLSVYEEALEASGPYRAWSRRRHNVSAALAKAHLSGVCEATEHMLRDVLRDNAHLRLAAFATKPDNYDGSAVLYDPSRITVRKTETQQLMPQHAQIAIACLCVDRTTDAEFWFVVLHLKSDGGGYNGSKERLRVQQAEAVLAFVDKQLHPQRPCVLAGDLNSDQSLVPEWTIKNVPHVKRTLETASFVSLVPPTVTYLHFDRSHFDYIFARSVSKLSHHVPSAKAPCPNKQQGSDHLPVYADVFVWHG